MKVKSIVVLIILTMLFGINCAYATDNENTNLQFQFETEDKVYQKDDIVTLEVKISNPNKIGINVFSFALDFDKDILELNKVYDEEEDEYVQDIKAYKSWEMNYDEEINSVTLTRSDLYKNDNERICKINFKVKKDFKESNMNIIGIESAGGAIDSYTQEDKQIELKGNEQTEPEEDLYLKTEKYKIGEEDTNNYTNGDKYIYRVSPNTQISEFINNLSTNGNISVYSANGEEQTNYDELVGTGMILKISKDNQTIELIISVLGDINENGKVGGDTLTELRGILYENMEVDELFIKSLDINGNKTIEAEDLTLIRGVLYEEQII